MRPKGYLWLELEAWATLAERRLDEPWPEEDEDPTLKRREEEEVSEVDRLKSVGVSRLLWVSQLNGALEPAGVRVYAYGEVRLESRVAVAVTQDTN